MNLGEETENKEMLDKIKELVPKEADLSKVEYEGPDVALYVRNIATVVY